MTSFAAIPAGEFEMGENDNDKFANDTERPRHRVSMRAFELALSPVSVRDVRAVLPDYPDHANDDLPATMLSWVEAMDFATAVGCRLPTEAEWEYAARAGSPHAYPWGDVLTTQHANYYYSEEGERVGIGRLMPSGRHPANAFGLYDMVGNICEWTEDVWHSTYHGAPTNGSAWTNGGRAGWRVLRGGAWDYLPRLLRVSWRDALPETTRRDNVGFRLARDLTRS